jgi:hypothetical protein
MATTYHLRAPGSNEALCGTRRHLDGRAARPALTISDETAKGTSEDFLCRRCVATAERRCGSVGAFLGVSAHPARLPLADSLAGR